MSQFYLPSSTATSVFSTPNFLDSDEEDTLPYPTPLPRSDFLAPDFEPSAYLSTLRNRHQTLEDLRGDLRARSQLLNKELLDLVNGNYEEFLSLGGDLGGGDEKIEGVRIGMLGFRKEIEGVQKAVQERMAEVSALVAERKEIRSDVAQGRALLEIDDQVTELEEALGVNSEEESLEDDDEDEDEDLGASDTNGTAATIIPLRKLQTNAQSYMVIVQAMQHAGAHHPFIIAQQARLNEARKTLLLDLSASLRQARASRSSETILAILDIYSDLGAERESVKVLKAS